MQPLNAEQSASPIAAPVYAPQGVPLEVDLGDVKEVTPPPAPVHDSSTEKQRAGMDLM